MKELLEETHCSRFTIHPGGMKIYKDLRHNYCWLDFMGYCTIYVSVFDESTSGSWTSLTSRVFTITFYSWMEVGTYYHGFCDKISKNLKG